LRFCRPATIIQMQRPEIIILIVALFSSSLSRYIPGQIVSRPVPNSPSRSPRPVSAKRDRRRGATLCRDDIGAAWLVEAP
jgi:hypothetical protein